MYALALISILFGQVCVADLVKTVFPHLIIPLVSRAPDTAFGTRKDATISYEVVLQFPSLYPHADP